MIVLLSPAKTLNPETPKVKNAREPQLIEKSGVLINILKKHKPAQLKKLMSVSDKIADLNASRYQLFSTPHTSLNAKPAAYAFAGDVYRGLMAEEFDARDLTFADKHVRILSGLYGILKPKDLMQDYRLEMGTKLKNAKGKDLYDFWGSDITDIVNEELKQQKSKLIVNLASKEYFKVLQRKDLQGTVYDIHFKEERGGQLKFMSFFAKKARGMMAHYIVKNRIKNIKGLEDFDMEGYTYAPSHSTDKELTFVR